jgi:glycosyltransferase involved in cell wall biosynthesis
MPNLTSPLVSIITPTYNHEKFIGPCIESVLNQTYANWEQLIIDDGSTDRTAQIIGGYPDPRIRYLFQENQGIETLAHTYNRALNEARGELIAILEGDDLWPLDKLATMVPAFSDKSTILAYGIPREINTLGELSRRLPKQVRNRLKLPETILANDPVGSATLFLLRGDGHEMIAPSTVIIRRSALKSIGGFQYVRNLCTTDFPTFLKLSQLGRFLFIPRVMGYRRRHVNSGVFCYLDQMASAVPDLVQQMLRELGRELSEDQRRAIEKSWQITCYVAEFTRGRLCLLEKRWRSARHHFQHALTLAQPRIFLAALGGWVLSWLHCDLEGVFRMAGRSELQRPAGGVDCLN